MPQLWQTWPLGQRVPLAEKGLERDRNSAGLPEKFEAKGRE